MEDPSFQLILPFALFMVAFAYASVGLGGGTAYLSILSFWILEPETLRPMAWGLNVVVSVVTLFNFRRKGHLDTGGIWPFVVGGLIGAAAGAAIPTPLAVFRWLLAVTLAGLAVWMLLPGRAKAEAPEPEPRRGSRPLGLLLGFLPGLLSGLVGLGGGIVLGPIVLALRLLPVKKTAALTSAYILMVSAGALGTHVATGGTMPWGSFAVPCLVVLLGGFLGSRFGAGKARPVTLRRILAVIVLTAAVNLVWKALA
jgi:uncharacterized membrane protein YfcA